jgi:hypothetical protein
MTIDVSVAARPSIFEPPALFSWALIGATVMPFISMAFAEAHPMAVPFVALLMALGGTHVIATFYLLSDPAIRRFCVNNPIKMVVVPCLIMAGSIALFSRPGPLFIGSLLALLLFQAWHFGAQNIGVAAFISLSDRGRPLAPFEKAAIRIGIWVGMLGILKVMAPMINEEYVPLPTQVVEFLDFFYDIGTAFAIPVIAVALWLAVNAWREKHLVYGLAIFLSVTFLITIYLTNDYYLGFLSFVTAHGLQYIVFLSTHSLCKNMQKTRRRLIFAAPVVLVMAMLLGHFVTSIGPHLSVATLPKLGLAIVFSIGLVHFWVDRFVWRMTNQERAGWIRDHFGQVIQPRRAIADRL